MKDHAERKLFQIVAEDIFANGYIVSYHDENESAEICFMSMEDVLYYFAHNVEWEDNEVTIYATKNKAYASPIAFFTFELDEKGADVLRDYSEHEIGKKIVARALKYIV